MKNSNFSYVFLIILIFEKTFASKLNLVVLQSSDVFFKHAIGSKVNSSEKAEDAINAWDNEGFIVANATQISNSLGDTVNGSTHLLLATKPSCLTTRLKDFGHTFLSIKLSSIIGRSLAVSEPSTTEDILQYDTSSSTSTQSPSTSTSSPPPSTSALPEVSTTTVPTKSPKQKLTITPAVLKLNTDNKYGTGKEIIKIALAPTVPKSLDTIKPKVEPATPPKVRRKRTLNSEEISQIHKIISLVSTNPDDDDSNVKDLRSKAIEGTHAAYDPEGGAETIFSDSFNQPGDEPIVVMNEPKKLSYETWRASMDKSFRPPGFYITVDDKVIFDNWIGVWQNAGVMGRWVPPTRQKLWNETELLLEFVEDPDRDIKISFEWEPMDEYSYVFLSNITISTYGPNATIPTEFQKPTNLNDSKVYNSTPVSTSIIGGDGNKNITLYIVVKSHPENGHEHSIHHPDNIIPSSSPEIPKASHNVTKKGQSNTLKIPIDNPNKKSKVSNPNDLEGLEKSLSKSKGGSQTVLYVALVTGVLSLVIMVTVIHKKMQLSRRQGRGC